MPRDRLLVVDDNVADRTKIRLRAEQVGYLVAEASSGGEIHGLLKRVDPTAVILELSADQAESVATLRTFAANDCQAKLVLSGAGAFRHATAVVNSAGASSLRIVGSLKKPLRDDHLTRVLKATKAPVEAIRKQELVAALRNREITPYFQPKMDIQSRKEPKPSGFEALARWRLADGRFVPPDEFVPLAETHGLMDDLTALMIDTVIDQQLAWMGRGINLPVSVNVSPTVAAKPDFAHGLIDSLGKAGLPPKLFAIEVTEQVAITNIATTIKVLTALRKHGVGVALDDFGSGYSSIVELYRLPLSELKLDRTLVADIDRSSAARHTLEAIVSLACDLRLSVCAEGIETQASVEYLRSIGCHQAQGFLFSAALPSGEVEAFLSQY